MLLEFNVKNFRSIKDQQSFSMIKTGGKELEENSFDTNTPVNFSLLRSSVIYGANGSGKSNLLKSLSLMRSIVVKSASFDPKGTIPVVPYLFDDKTADEPSEFEVTFISGGVRYQYGFSATKLVVHDEWLIAYPKGQPQQWFSRVWDQKQKKHLWKFGSNFTGKKTTWRDLTPDNTLFLSRAIQLNSELLVPVFDWFYSKLHITSVRGWGNEFSSSICSGEGKDQFLKLFSSVDLDIEDFEHEKVDAAELVAKNFSPSVRAALVKEFELEGEERTRVFTIRKRTDGQNVKLSLDEESDGTQRLYSLAGPWLDSLASGEILVIDELHSQLHPNMVRFLVSLFNNPATNPNNAQLIFTTHETSILDQDVFRRDQIWFCEIEQFKGTDIYLLTDFKKVRQGRENIEAAYLSGKFGAVPYISPPELL